MRYLRWAMVSLMTCTLIAGPATAQETVLNGIMSRLAPESRISWSSGVAKEGVETYSDLFIGQGQVRVRMSEARVRPDGAFARVEAEGVVVNLDEEEGFSLELGDMSISVPASMLSAIRNVKGVPDLCQIAGGGASVEADGIRLLRTFRRDGGLRVRSEIRIDTFRVTQQAVPTGSGCEIRIGLDLNGAEEARSDKSGLRVDRTDLTLTFPGNLQSLASTDAPDLSATFSFGGVLWQAPGGATITSARDGALEARISAASAVPALTAHLRGRDGPNWDRAVKISRALLPGDLSLAVDLNGVTVLAEALIPAHLISGLSRASLTSVIGDYQAGLDTSSGRATLRVSSDVIGIGSTRFEADALLSERDPEAPRTGLPAAVERLLPRMKLGRATLSHRDLGLLRAFELITGSPTSVAAAIYLQSGADALPAEWRPAALRAVSELARFLSLTTTEGGAELILTTPSDLSIGETYRLMTLRPDLSERLISSEVRRSDP